MYDLIGTDSIMNIPSSDKTQIIQEPQVVIQEKEQIIGFATMVQETMKQKLKEEHPIVPLPIVQEAPSAPVIEARPAVETAAVINSAPPVVSEIPMEIPYSSATPPSTLAAQGGNSMIWLLGCPRRYYSAGCFLPANCRKQD